MIGEVRIDNWRWVITWGINTGMETLQTANDTAQPEHKLHLNEPVVHWLWRKEKRTQCPPLVHQTICLCSPQLSIKKQLKMSRWSCHCPPLDTITLLRSSPLLLRVPEGVCDSRTPRSDINCNGDKFRSLQALQQSSNQPNIPITSR